LPITDSGFVNLILAIFRYTAQDLKYGTPELKRQAEEFLSGEDSWWFVEMCDVFGGETDIDNIRKMIRENSVSWRDKYE
jgi:hypothetical protein